MLYKVKALADRVGVTAETVRHYQRLGLLMARRDPHNGYKLFDEEQEQRLRFITRMRRLGFSLREIAAVLDDVDHGRSPCPRVRELLRQHIEEERRRQEELAQRLTRMEAIRRRWEAIDDAPPRWDVLCPLIEVAEEEATC